MGLAWDYFANEDLILLLDNILLSYDSSDLQEG